MGAPKAGAVPLMEQHGTRMSWQRRCRFVTPRCEPCWLADRMYQAEYRRRRAETGGHLRVPAEPVREHIARLHKPFPSWQRKRWFATEARQARTSQRLGLSLWAIALSADVDVTTVWRIWERKQRYVDRSSAERILAVMFTDSTFVDSGPTRRRVAELSEVGIRQFEVTNYVKRHVTKRRSDNPYPQSFQWRDVISRERADLVERFYRTYFHDILHRPTPEEREEVISPTQVRNTENARASRQRRRAQEVGS